MSKGATVEFNNPILNQIDENIEKALVITAGLLQDEIRESMVIPRDLGTLQGEAFFIDDSDVKDGVVRLCHDTPYARRMYFHPEYNFQTASWVDEQGRQHGGNVNAQGLWFTLWEEGGYYEDVPLGIFADVLSEIMGGNL